MIIEFEQSEIIFWIFKILKYHNFKIMSAVQMWMVSYHHFNIFSNQNFFIKKGL